MNRTYIFSAKDFGEAARAARKEKSLSQAQLAQQSGCSQRFVSEVERGKPTAELERSLGLLFALGIPVAIGNGDAVSDGRAEVSYAVVRIAEELGMPPRKRKKLADHLKAKSDES